MTADSFQVSDLTIWATPVKFTTAFKEGGILPSEAFAVVNIVRSLQVARLIESGRFRGFSTRLFADNLPQLDELVSIDFGYLPFYREVEREFRTSSNVRLLYGDSFGILPRLLRDSTRRTALLLDGPKGEAAVRLISAAFEQNEQLCVAFLHDCYQGSMARAAVERRFDQCWFSDDPAFLSGYCHLDTLADGVYGEGEYRQQSIEKYHLDRDGLGRADQSYGPTMSVIFRPANARTAKPSAARAWLKYAQARARAELVRRIRRR